MFADHHAALVEEFGVDEADFRMALLGTVGDWEKTKELIRQREMETGADYSELLMRAGFAGGGISGDEVVELVERGIQLPDDAVHMLTYTGQLDTAAQLSKHGLLLNVNEINPVTGANAIGTFIQQVGYLPGRYTPDEVRKGLRQLVEIGVDPTDGMQYALENINASNGDLKLEMVHALIDQGVLLTEQHRSLVSEMKDGAYKQELLKLL